MSASAVEAFQYTGIQVPTNDDLDKQEDGNVILKLLNFDDLFKQSPSPVLLNDFNFAEPGYAERLSRNVFSRSGSVSFVAKCDCEYLQGTFHVNTVCPMCKTKPTMDVEAIDGHLRHKVWIAAPRYLSRGQGGLNQPSTHDPSKEIYWMHPIIYRILSNWLGHSRAGRSYLDDIINPNLPLPPILQSFVTGRGWRYLYDNFDQLMWTFCNNFRPTAKKNPQVIATLIKENRHAIFCRHFPIMASALHPVISSDPAADSSAKSKRQVDSSSKYILDVATALSFLEYRQFKPRRGASIDAVVHRMYLDYVAYVEDIIATRLSGKKSLMRQHIFGARYHLSFRGVIVPITDVNAQPHDLHLPWSMSVKLLKPMIMNRLFKKGMTLNAALGKHRRAVLTYDPDIDQIMEDLIREVETFPGIPVLFNRNPSLRRGAVQTLFVVKVKKNPREHAIALSPLILKDPNADKHSQTSQYLV